MKARVRDTVVKCSHGVSVSLWQKTLLKLMKCPGGIPRCMQGAARKPPISSVIKERPQCWTSARLLSGWCHRLQTRLVSPQWLNTTDGSHLEGFQSGILALRIMRFSFDQCWWGSMAILFSFSAISSGREPSLERFYEIFQKCNIWICKYTSVLFCSELSNDMFANVKVVLFSCPIRAKSFILFKDS